jgi:hypothetical protein
MGRDYGRSVLMTVVIALCSEERLKLICRVSAGKQ